MKNVIDVGIEMNLLDPYLNMKNYVLDAMKMFLIMAKQENQADESSIYYFYIFLGANRLHIKALYKRTCNGKFYYSE